MASIARKCLSLMIIGCYRGPRFILTTHCNRAAYCFTPHTDEILGLSSQTPSGNGPQRQDTNVNITTAPSTPTSSTNGAGSSSAHNSPVSTQRPAPQYQRSFSTPAGYDSGYVAAAKRFALELHLLDTPSVNKLTNQVCSIPI